MAKIKDSDIYKWATVAFVVFYAFKDFFVEKPVDKRRYLIAINPKASMLTDYEVNLLYDYQVNYLEKGKSVPKPSLLYSQIEAILNKYALGT